ncbi:MAG: hypothetical protein ACRD2Y_11515, partial [Terriglobales bacterium]
KGSANTECSHLIISSVVRTLRKIGTGRFYSPRRHSGTEKGWNADEYHHEACFRLELVAWVRVFSRDDVSGKGLATGPSAISRLCIDRAAGRGRREEGFTVSQATGCCVWGHDERRARKGRKLRAQGSVTISISEEGDVVEAKLVRASSPEAGDLLLTRARSLKFKARPGCGNFKTTVNYKLNQ